MVGLNYFSLLLHFFKLLKMFNLLNATEMVVK